jgi:hypothetical protein
MATYEIADFKEGMDLRKMYETAPAGSLRLLRNAVITPGAEIIKRNAFVVKYAVPTASFGIISRNGVLYTVQAGATASVVEPTASAIGMVTLVLPAGVASFTGISDWDIYKGNFYIVMTGNNGLHYHYYNQAQVTDPLATSNYVRTYGGKMYGLDGRYLRFSANNDPTVWTVDTPSTNGAGYIDLSGQDADSTTLVGMEVYYDQMAIFSQLSTQFWILDPVPGNDVFKQLLRQTGLVSRHGLTQFGSGDVMYLSPYGVRSLRVQNVSLTAGTTDIGTPVDVPIRDLIWANGIPWFHTTKMVIQPRTGRLWLIMPDRAYVLSTFQEPAITAWSYFDFAFTVADCVVADPYVYLRGTDNNIYYYGGSHLDVFDDTEAEVILPALSFDKPNINKIFTSFSIACSGTWSVSASMDPTNQDAEELVATVTDSNFITGLDRMPGWSTHISLRLRTTDASAATLGKILVTYETGEVE